MSCCFQGEALLDEAAFTASLARRLAAMVSANKLTHTMPLWTVAVESILLRASQISTSVHEEVLRLLTAAARNLPPEVRSLSSCEYAHSMLGRDTSGRRETGPNGVHTRVASSEERDVPTGAGAHRCWRGASTARWRRHDGSGGTRRNASVATPRRRQAAAGATVRRAGTAVGAAAVRAAWVGGGRSMRRAVRAREVDTPAQAAAAATAGKCTRRCVIDVA